MDPNLLRTRPKRILMRRSQPDGHGLLQLDDHRDCEGYGTAQRLHAMGAGRRSEISSVGRERTSVSGAGRVSEEVGLPGRVATVSAGD